MLAEQVGHLVTRARVLADLEPEDLAARLGRDVGWVLLVELGRAELTLVDVEQIAAALDVDIQSLLVG